MSDDTFDLPDIPLPDVVEETTIADEFTAAVKYAFLGIGYAGGNLAQTFWNIGYRRVCAVNTAAPDLAELKLPDKNKLCLEVGGAAKDRTVGRQAISDNQEKILSFMREAYGQEVERLMVCASLGGGTGSGGFATAVDVATELMIALRQQEIGGQTRVGLILVIPSNSERDYMRNAYDALKEAENLLKTKKVSPVVLIDNEQARRLYGAAGIGKSRDKINRSIAGIFHLFNLMAAKNEGVYTPFDRADYSSLLNNGLLTYGLAGVQEPTLENLSKALTSNLTTNALSAGVDVQSSKFGAGLLIGPAASMDEIPSNVVEGAFEGLKRVMPRAIIHRGVYGMERPLAVYTAAAGVGMPKQRLNEISRIAGLQDWDT